MKHENIRNSNIEVLRLVLMMAIFGWHVFVHGYGFKNYGEEAFMPNIYVTFFLTALFAPATYSFMFISGYYGMKFSIKKFFSIEMWLIITSVVTMLGKVILFDDINLKGLICSFFPISSFRWWFMTNYMLLYLVTPILNKGIENLSKGTFKIILICLLGYNFFSFVRFHSGGGSDFIGLTTIFLIGRYCSIYKLDIPKNKSLVTFFICWIILFSLMLICNGINAKSVFILLNYNTPLVTIMAISLFYFVKGLDMRSSVFINKLLKPTLFIYLVTDGLFQPFYFWMVKQFNENIFLGVFYFVLVVIACLVFGHITISSVDIVMNKFFNYLRKFDAIRNIES